MKCRKKAVLLQQDSPGRRWIGCFDDKIIVRNIMDSTEYIHIWPVILMAAFFLLCLWKCREKLGKAYCAAAKYAPTVALRREYSRKAVLAGNREAGKIFAITIADEVSAHKPLEVFKRKKIPCVHTGFYFPSRYQPYLSERQARYCKDVLDFKDGKQDGIRFLTDGISRLKPKPGTVVLFMPCSTQRKYWTRFSRMADYVRDECPQLVNGIGYIRYISERGSLHLQKDRANARLEKNYFFQEDLAGKEVLVVDDIFTTGRSLLDFKKEVEANGGRITGAIFAAGTFRMPGMFRCFIEAMCHTGPTGKEDGQEPAGEGTGWKDRREKATEGVESMASKNRTDGRPAGRFKSASNHEEPDDEDWMPDRSIVQGNTLINLYYGMRGGKRVVVKKEVLPLDGEDGETDTKGLEEFDLRI